MTGKYCRLSCGLFHEDSYGAWFKCGSLFLDQCGEVVFTTCVVFLIYGPSYAWPVKGEAPLAKKGIDCRQ